jgi:hypothetical protein
MQYDKTGATLFVDGQTIGRIDSGIARLVTDKAGRPKTLVGISEHVETVSLALGAHSPRRKVLQLDEVFSLDM